jgi:hypothetical protein
MVAHWGGQGRQQHRSQNGDDGDHNQQFDQGEPTRGPGHDRRFHG